MIDRDRDHVNFRGTPEGHHDDGSFRTGFGRWTRQRQGIPNSSESGYPALSPAAIRLPDKLGLVSRSPPYDEMRWILRTVGNGRHIPRKCFPLKPADGVEFEQVPAVPREYSPTKLTHLMTSIRIVLFSVAVCLYLPSASAQQRGNQTGGTTGAVGTGTGGTTGGGGGFGGAQDGIGQTANQGIGGRTAGGGAGGASDLGGFAGGNAAEGFVGGGDPQGFVGGGRESELNSQTNRLFRGITDAEVPTGTTQESTGNPRRVPVQLKLGFAVPAPSASLRLAGPSAGSLDRYRVVRPELAQVRVTMSPDGTATLAGTTSDAASRRLAENLLRLQPGVRQVNSQIRSASTLIVP